MTETAERGAEAYRQAYEYVVAGGAYHTKRKRLKAAWRYLRLTASPPLSDDEETAARTTMRRMRREAP